MGASSAETVTEIRELRGRLDEDVRELQRRLPEPTAWLKRAAIVAAGGVVALLVIRRMARRRRARKLEAEGDWVLVRASDLGKLNGVRKLVPK